ncbi:hypothetical protein [Haloferax larsenii]|uniref:Uncharacterized protein n=1 Tax=Haloferax larsenii TaxID=302484 RepID=A0A1H7T469_HALLR|nr:hypothetical protein [Haloferax larsenii]SEL79528.1 hypothetical protein SAMN04488691_10862 [Haloferax larsenii]
MKATIYGEDEVVTGVEITDNNNVEHDIQIKREGEIHSHQQDGYPDKAAKRTREGNEHVEQARAFARYYVYATRGYETVSPPDNPVRINAVRLAIQELSDAEFESLFGDLYQQMRSYHDETPRAIDIPAGAPGPNSVLYHQDVYLGVDPTETELEDAAVNLAVSHGINLDEDALNEQAVSSLSTEALTDWESFGSDLADLASEAEADLTAGVYVDAVSSLYTSYVGGDEYVVTEPDESPFEREPDTHIELPPVEPGPLDEFREFLDHHLKCQVRDCFVRMGAEPPEPFRVLGTGRFESTAAYKLMDIYPEYHDPEERSLLGKVRDLV